MSLEEIIRHRRSVRIFDDTYPFDHESVTRALQLAILAPNSSNLQTWEFYRIRSKEKIAALMPYGLNQKALRTASELVLFVSRRDLWKKRCQWHLEDIKTQLAKGSKNEKRLRNGLRYYGRLMPFLYRSDFLGIHTLIRWLFMIYRDLLGKPMLRWITLADTQLVSNKSLALAAENFMLAMTDAGYDTCPMEGFDQKHVKKIIGLPHPAFISMIIACGKGKPEGIYYERRRLDYREVVFEVR